MLYTARQVPVITVQNGVEMLLNIFKSHSGIAK